MPPARYQAKAPALLRAANLRIANAEERYLGIRSERLTIMCECSWEGCEDMFMVAQDDFRDACALPGASLVAPEHLDGADIRILAFRVTHWLTVKVQRPA